MPKVSCSGDKISCGRFVFRFKKSVERFGNLWAAGNRKDLALFPSEMTEEQWRKEFFAWLQEQK